MFHTLEGGGFGHLIILMPLATAVDRLTNSPSRASSYSKQDLSTSHRWFELCQHRGEIPSPVWCVPALLELRSAQELLPSREVLQQMSLHAANSSAEITISSSLTALTVFSHSLRTGWNVFPMHYYFLFLLLHVEDDHFQVPKMS